MVRREEKLPSDKDKQIDDGTLGLEICHQGKKSEFVMAFWAENLPSDKDKQIDDGKLGWKFAIRERKASLRWHIGRKTYRQIIESKSAIVRRTKNVAVTTYETHPFLYSQHVRNKQSSTWEKGWSKNGKSS
ncbi:MAG: hypothetical protein LKG40_03265 [Lachnospiraceae bacterium]|jgi:hypothetical protein|nr:hypothetical protein [Lachnospiraceae bacterium]